MRLLNVIKVFVRGVVRYNQCYTIGFLQIFRLVLSPIDVLFFYADWDIQCHIKGNKIN